jgi:hypothetical protein
MKFAADTGALLSLACSDVFELIVKHHTFAATDEVIKELKQFALYEDFLGRKAKEVENIIEIEKPLQLLSLNIEAAELSIFSLGKENKYIILTDDTHAARIAQEKIKLQTKPSFFVFILMYNQGIISKEQLIHNINLVAKQRKWMTGSLYEYVQKLIETFI